MATLGLFNVPRFNLGCFDNVKENDMTDKYPPKPAKPNETPQQAAERVASDGGSRMQVLDAYEARRQALGLKIDLPD